MYTDEDVHALSIEELVIDVGKDEHTITAEAVSMGHVGVNMVRHARRGEIPENLIFALIEGIEKLGISPARYRIVREDLPPAIPVELRQASQAPEAP